MMPLTAACIVSTRVVLEQAHSCIQNLPVRLAIEHGVGQTSAAEADELLDRIERHRVDVVLVETSLLGIPLEEFVRRLRNTTSQPAVFVVNPEASPEMILEALRAGANEYLYPPLGESLRDALQRLSTARSKGGSDAAKALGRVFGFISARGGCGASTFVVHVAPEIARQTKQQTLLADLDFEAGIIRFLMKTRNNYTVRDAIDNLHRMDSNLWKGLVSSLPDKVDVMPASDDVATKRTPTREEMTHFLRFMRSTYPVSIVDFGRSISVAALHSLPEIEKLFVVTTPDNVSLQHARTAIGIIEQRGLPDNRIAVLLNRVHEKKTDLAEVEKVLGRPADVRFRDDHLALYDAWSEGRFLPASNPLAKEFRGFAEALRNGGAPGQPEMQAEQKTNESKGKFSLRGLSFLQKVPGFGKDQQRAQA